MTPKEAARARRNARQRLLRYLLNGGRLVEDESGHYCRAARSGDPFDGKMVSKIIQQGIVHGSQPHVMVRDPNGQKVWYLAATD